MVSWRWDVSAGGAMVDDRPCETWPAVIGAWTVLGLLMLRLRSLW
jgi:hypothetical protein